MGLFGRKGPEAVGNQGQSRRMMTAERKRPTATERQEIKGPRELERIFELKFKVMLAEYYSQNLKLKKNVDNGNPARMVDFMARYPDTNPSFLKSFLQLPHTKSELGTLIDDLQLDSTPGVSEDYANGYILKTELLPSFERDVQSGLLASGLQRKIIQPAKSLKKADHRAIRHGLSLYQDGVLPPPKGKALSESIAVSTISILLDKNAGKQADYIQELHSCVGMPKDKPDIDFALSIAAEIKTIRDGGLSHLDDLDHIQDLAEGFTTLAETNPENVKKIFEAASVRNVVSAVMHEHAEATMTNDHGRVHKIELLGEVTCTDILTSKVLQQNTRAAIEHKRATEAMTASASQAERKAPSAIVADSDTIKVVSENNDQVETPIVKRSVFSGAKVGESAPKVPTPDTVNQQPTTKITITDPRIDPRMHQPFGPTIKVTFKPKEQASRDIKNAMKKGLNVAAVTTVASGVAFGAAPQAAATPSLQQTISQVHTAAVFAAPETAPNVEAQVAPKIETVSQAPGTLIQNSKIDKIEDGPSERRVNRPEASMRATAHLEVEDRGDNVLERERKQRQAMGSVPVDVVVKSDAKAGEPGVQIGIADALAEFAPYQSNIVRAEATTISMESTLAVPGMQQAPPAARQIDVAPVAATVTNRPVKDIYANVREKPMGVSRDIQERRALAYQESGTEGMTVNDLISKYASEYGQQGLSKGSPSVELEAAISSRIDRMNKNGNQKPLSKEAFARVVAALQYPDMLNSGALDQRFMTVPMETNGRKLSEAEIVALNNYIIQKTPDIIKNLNFTETDDAFYDDAKKNVFARGVIVSDLINVGDPIIADLVKKFAPKVAQTEVRPPETKPAEQAPAPREGNEAVNSSAHLEKALLKFGVPDKYVKYYIEFGAKYKVNPMLLAAQGKQESGFDPDIKSPVGAGGISQFMPGTWEGWKDTLNFPSSATRMMPEYAIHAQAAMMASNIKKADGNVNLALAAYNAGWGNAKKAMQGWDETRGYIRNINAHIDKIENYTKQFAAASAPKPAPNPAPKTPERPSSSGVKIHSGNPEAQAQLDSILKNNKHTGSQLWTGEQPMLEAVLKEAGYQNGRLSTDKLMVVDSYGHMLNETAGRAFKDMVAAYESETGRKDFIIQPTKNTAYRTYDKQVDLRWPDGKDKPFNKFAAEPGTSNHGWGLAIDIKGLFGNQGFDQPLYKWIINNSHRFGFFHAAAHAENGSIPEAHHLNFMLEDY